MSDVEKLMAKMKGNKIKTEEETVKKIEDDIAEMEEDEEEVEEDVEEKKKETPKISPKTQEENPIEHEVAILQNDGVFRRELVLGLKELINVIKVNTQAIIDIKKKLVGE